MMYDGRKASVPLHFIVVGGGIGGLSTAHCLNKAGHKVTLVDPSDLPAEIGAGLSLSPNVTRLLNRWGLYSQLESQCSKQKGGFSCRYDTDDQIFRLEYSNPLNDGAKFYGVSRPYLVTMLYDLTKDEVTIVKGKTVSVDPETPSITLEDGKVLFADVIIGADGIGSVVRPTILPPPDQPVVSGDACYRALIPIEDMRKDPDLSTIPIDDLQFWEAPDKKIIAYGIGPSDYNFVLVVTDSDPNGHWSVLADLKELSAAMEGWAPRARKLVSLVKSAVKFKLVMRAPSDTWVHNNGRVAILGDAAHAMLPYYAQGAAMAIEDAAVLGNLFSRISSRDEIGQLLRAYQTIRAPRANATHAKSLGNGNPNHTAEAWRAREGPDAGIPEFVTKAQALREVPEELDWKIFTEREFVQTQYGYDADREVDNWWAQNKGKAMEQSRL